MQIKQHYLMFDMYKTHIKIHKRSFFKNCLSLNFFEYALILKYFRNLFITI